MRKCCIYSPDRNFVRIRVNMTKQFGPIEARGFWPPYPKLGYAPGLLNKQKHDLGKSKVIGVKLLNCGLIFE